MKKLLIALIFLPTLLHSAAEQPTNKIVRPNSAEMAALSYLQAHTIQQRQTEEYVDLSCSCFGPKFYDIKCLPCLKSQPLPAHIQGKMVPDKTDFGPEKLHYFDTIENKSLGRVDCPSKYFCCCPCFIKPKLPAHIAIRKNEFGKVYCDKNSRLELSQVSNSCLLGCADCLTYVFHCDNHTEDDLSN